MSLDAIKAVFARTDLPPYERLVMLALAERADDEMTCFPSIADICQRTGMAERGVQGVLHRLEAGGFLVVKRGGGRRMSNGYLLLIPAPDAGLVDPTPAPGAPFTEHNPAPGALFDTTLPRTGRPVLDENPAPGAENPAPDAPEPSLTKKKKEKKESLLIGFEEFWETVPRQVAKAAAQKAYVKALAKTDAATILSGMIAYAESRRGEEDRYTAHPASWLNAERWNDKITKPGGTNGKPDRLDAMLRGAAPPLDRGPDRYPPQPLLASG